MDVEENCHLTSADSEQYHTELTVSAWIHLMFCFLLVWKFNATRVGIWTDKIAGSLIPRPQRGLG